MNTLKLVFAAVFLTALASCATTKKDDDCCKPGTDCSKSEVPSCKGDSCCAPDTHKAKK